VDGKVFRFVRGMIIEYSKGCAAYKKINKKMLETGVGSPWNVKKYLVELNNGKCVVCGLNEWMGKSIALVIDHINGNSDDNRLVNLRIICNNCDAQSGTFKARNCGKGRHSLRKLMRRQRYANGQSS
jgi:hypothetical protein